jgi:hypothetical protein
MSKKQFLNIKPGDQYCPRVDTSAILNEDGTVSYNHQGDFYYEFEYVSTESKKSSKS